MTRPKTSPIWKISRDELERLVRDSTTMVECLSFFGLKHKGRNYKTFHMRCANEGIDSSKFAGNFGKGTLKPRWSLNDILVVGSLYTNRTCLKKRLLKAGLLINKCAECDLEPMWNSKPLTMVLDHRNGIDNDYRLENLRLLCPNCNSQTLTFAGRSKRRITWV